MEASDKIAAVHKYLDAFDKQDINIIRDIFADDAIVEDPVGTDIHDGIEALCTFYEGALATGTKLVLTGEPRCTGNAVAFPFQAQATGLTVDIIDVFEFNDEGKVNSMRAYWGPENMKG